MNDHTKTLAKARKRVGGSLFLSSPFSDRDRVRWKGRGGGRGMVNLAGRGGRVGEKEEGSLDCSPPLPPSLTPWTRHQKAIEFRPGEEGQGGNVEKRAMCAIFFNVCRLPHDTIFR